MRYLLFLLLFLSNFAWAGSAELLVGIWKGKKNETIEFRSDGTMLKNNDPSTLMKWQLDGNKLIFVGEQKAAAPKKGYPDMRIQYRKIEVNQKELVIATVTMYGTIRQSFVRSSDVRPLEVFKTPKAKEAEKPDYKLSLQIGHQRFVSFVGFSPDGQYLLSASDQNMVIWSKESGRQIRNLSGISCFVTVNFLGAGKSYTGGDTAWSSKGIALDGIPCERESIAKELEQGNTLASFSEIQNKVSTAVFSPDGKYVLAGGMDGYLKLYDASTGKSLVSYKSDDNAHYVGHIQFARFSHSGEFIVTAVKGSNADILLWKTKTSEILKTVSVNANQFVYVGFVPGSDSMVLSAQQDKLTLWDMQQGKVQREFAGHTGAVSAVDVSSNGKTILSGDEQGKLILWDQGSGKKLKTWEVADNGIRKLALLPDDSHAVVALANTVLVLDLVSGQQQDLVEQTGKSIQDFALSPDGKHVAVVFKRELGLSLWDVNQRRLVRSFESKVKPVGIVRFSDDNRYINIYSDPPRYWDLSTGREGSDPAILAKIASKAAEKTGRSRPRIILDDKIIARLKKEGASLPPNVTKSSDYLKTVSPDKRLEIKTGTIGIRPDYFKLIDRKTGRRACKMQHPTPGLYDSVGDAMFSRNGNFIIGVRKRSSGLGSSRFSSKPETSTIFIWDVKTCRVVDSFPEPDHFQIKYTLLDSPDGKHIIVSNAQNNLVLYDVADEIQNVDSAGYNWPPGNSANLTQRYTLSGIKGTIAYAQFSRDSKRVLTGGKDVKITLWDVASGEVIANILPLPDSDDSIIYTADNRYLSTKRAFSALSITQGMQAFSFEQFDLRLNRPDLVVDKLSGVKSKISSAYYKAYKKRLAKLGFTPDMLDKGYHTPEVKIKNVAKIASSTTKEKVTLEVAATDSKYHLDRFNVWVNDVPLYGKKGLDLKSLNSNSVEKKVEITLSSGVNNIQVSAINTRAAESLKAEKVVISTRPVSKPQLHIIAIGVSKYQNAKMNLNYAAKDARDLIDVYKNKQDLFSKINVYQFTNKDAVLANIQAVRNKLLSTNVNDRVLVFYAGHGILDKDFNYYLATYNMNFNKPAGSGMTYDQLESLIDGIPARDKLVFIDACHSGEVDKDEIKVALSKFVKKGPVKFSRGFEGQKKIVGLDDSFALAKELFVDLRRQSGATVISSAGGAELAVEDTRWKNGVFSYCLFNGLRNNSIDGNNDNKTMVSELQGYLQQCVSELTNNLQKPTSRAENIASDFQIW